MEMRYDGYYEKEVFYKMTLEELHSFEHWADEHILAYMRHVGIENLIIVAKTTPPQNILFVPFLNGMALCSGKKQPTMCKIVDDESHSYNPFKDSTCTIHKDHWYSPYKLKYTSIEFEGVIESMYVCDFCSHVRDGKIELIETPIEEEI